VVGKKGKRAESALGEKKGPLEKRSFCFASEKVNKKRGRRGTWKTKITGGEDEAGRETFWIQLVQKQERIKARAEGRKNVRKHRESRKADNHPTRKNEKEGKVVGGEKAQRREGKKKNCRWHKDRSRWLRNQGKKKRKI